MAKDITVKLNLDPLEKILKKRNLEPNGAAQKKCASELKRMCDPYVPMNTGTLKNTAQVQNDGVLYTQVYSAVQYYNNSGWNGQRGKEWDKRMMADKGKQYIEACSKIIGGEKV